MGEGEYDVLWHSTWDTFRITTLEAPEKPTYEEAAQIVSVIEDINQSDVRVDSVKNNDE